MKTMTSRKLANAIAQRRKKAGIVFGTQLREPDEIIQTTVTGVIAREFITPSNIDDQVARARALDRVGTYVVTGPPGLRTHTWTLGLPYRNKRGVMVVELAGIDAPLPIMQVDLDNPRSQNAQRGEARMLAPGRTFGGHRPD